MKLTHVLYCFTSANQVQNIGDSIETDTSRRSIIQHKPLIKRRRDSIQLDPKDPDSRIVVPVTQKKLDKLLMFYYIKKRYPKLVDHIVDTEAGGLKTNIEGNNASLTVNLNKSISALEELSENRDSTNLPFYVNADTREGPRNIEDDKSQSVVTGEQIETMKAIKSSGHLKDKTIDSIMSNLVDHEVGENEQSRFESMNIDLDDGDSSVGDSSQKRNDSQVGHVNHNNTTIVQENIKKAETDTTPASQTQKLSKFAENFTNHNNEVVKNEATDLSSTNNKESFVKSEEESSNQIEDQNNPLVAAKSLLKDVEDLQQSISKEDEVDGSNNSIKKTSDVSTDCAQVGCITKELVNLFDQTYTEQSSLNENLNGFNKMDYGDSESFVDPTQQRVNTLSDLQREITPRVEGNRNVNFIKEFSNTENAGTNLGESSFNNKKLNLQNKVDLKTNLEDSQTADVSDSSVLHSLAAKKENKDSHQNDKQQNIKNHSLSNPNKDDVEVFPGFFRHKHPQEETGQTRKGGDPYSSIGHNSLRHDHDESSVVANKYYDKSIGRFITIIR